MVWCAGAAATCKSASGVSSGSARTSAGWVSGSPGSASGACRFAPPLRRAARPRKRLQGGCSERVKAAIADEAHGTAIVIWLMDEARVGRQGRLPRIWAKRGRRPRAVRDRRTTWADLFGAVYPKRGVGAAVVMPTVHCRGHEHPPGRDQPGRERGRPCCPGPRRCGLAHLTQAAAARQHQPAATAPLCARPCGAVPRSP
jgi:hypothetical protein